MSRNPTCAEEEIVTVQDLIDYLLTCDPTSTPQVPKYSNPNGPFEAARHVSDGEESGTVKIW